MNIDTNIHHKVVVVVIVVVIVVVLLMIMLLLLMLLLFLSVTRNHFSLDKPFLLHFEQQKLPIFH